LIFNAESGELWSDTADPDRDGVPNLVEYILAREPLSAESGGPLAPRIDSSGRLELTFSTRAGFDGAVSSVAWTDRLDGGIWRTDGLFTELVDEDENTGTVTWRVTFDSADSLPPRVFFRLQAARAP